MFTSMTITCPHFSEVVIFGWLVFLSHFVHESQARAYFVFGDSVVDIGNNNYLFTRARANSPPYGIDHPTHRATGRFSNGLNLADIVGEKIGAKPLLPYLSPELLGERLLTGANFASAGVGILNDTGIQFGEILRIGTQLDLFEEYQEKVSALTGKDRAQRLVNQAATLIVLGGNDFINNYYLVPFSFRSRQYAIPEYVQHLIQEYQKILMRLYELGGRRVIVTGIGPIGCVPGILARRSTRGECVAELQQAAASFNTQLATMIRALNKKLGSETFVAAQAFNMKMNLISNPQAFGFKSSNEACCGQGPFNGRGLCTARSNLCSSRDLHVFWDQYHPSERAARLIAEQMMSGSDKYMSPMNLSTIIELDSRI
uniref:GDSL esterase/lipase n=1 Tax=Kalanchoe fedtschenkoi TaxID=63787 RepID=A0A7N0SYD9_KALFE